MFKETYRRIQELGSGAYGSAYKVQRRDDPQIVHASKEIRLGHMNHRECETARVEADLLRKLSHPNIIGYVGVFLEEQRLYIIMEFADKGDLSKKIRARREGQKPFTERRISLVVSQIAGALDYIHAHKVLHRDLKPLNIFLTKEDDVKLGDFGIACVLDGDSAVAHTQIGTPHYLSPEVLNREAYGTKSDWWSLGVVTYELAALRVPFHAQSLPAVGLAILRASPAPLPECYSTALGDLVARLLEKSPAARAGGREVRAHAVLRHHQDAPERRKSEGGPPEVRAHAVLRHHQDAPERRQSEGGPPETPPAAPAPWRRRSAAPYAESLADAPAPAPGPAPGTRPGAGGAPRRGADGADEQVQLRRLESARLEAQEDRRRVRERLQLAQREEEFSAPSHVRCAAKISHDSGQKEELLRALERARVQAQDDRRAVKARMRSFLGDAGGEGARRVGGRGGPRSQREPPGPRRADAGGDAAELAGLSEAQARREARCRVEEADKLYALARARREAQADRELVRQRMLARQCEQQPLAQEAEARQAPEARRRFEVRWTAAAAAAEAAAEAADLPRGARGRAADAADAADADARGRRPGAAALAAAGDAAAAPAAGARGAAPGGAAPGGAAPGGAAPGGAGAGAPTPCARGRASAPAPGDALGGVWGPPWCDLRRAAGVDAYEAPVLRRAGTDGPTSQRDFESPFADKEHVADRRGPSVSTESPGGSSSGTASPAGASDCSEPAGWQVAPGKISLAPKEPRVPAVQRAAAAAMRAAAGAGAAAHPAAAHIAADGAVQAAVVELEAGADQAVQAAAGRAVLSAMAVAAELQALAAQAPVNSPSRAVS